MTPHPIIAIGGENLIDHVTTEGQVSAKAGGSPFNVAMGLGRQGALVRYVTPISRDAWGDELAAVLQASGVELAGGRVPQPTTMARVTVTKGIPSYHFERDGTAERAVTLAHIQERLRDVAALHCGSLAVIAGEDGDAWEAAMAAAHDAGLFVSLDPNARLSMIEDTAAWRARIARIAAKSDLIKLSDEDLAALYPDLEEGTAIATLRAQSGAPLIVLTRGAEGASAFGATARADVPAPLVRNLVDAVGAGDTFMATLLATLAQQRRLTRAAVSEMSAAELIHLLSRAGKAAAINCGREGCNPPTNAEIDAT